MLVNAKSRRGHAACVSVLLAKGCWRDAPDAADDCPLHLAARHGGLEAVKALVEAGAKLHVPNKRSLTPFAEAVLAGRIDAAEYLAGRAEGGLAAALAVTYRSMPLLHLAAGLGRATAVEWLLGLKGGCELDAVATDAGLTCLHAAALSGDEETVQVLLEKGADPLSHTQQGKMPLELVPKVAPPKAPPPPPPPGSLPLPEGPDADAGDEKRAREQRALVRSARRAFKALARAAVQKGGASMGKGAAARRRRETGAGGGSDGDLGADGDQEDAVEEAEEEEEESPAAMFLRQFLEMSTQQQMAKVESYARMSDRQVAELPYLDSEAQTAISGLRHAMSMVELFGAIAALRADEDFQADIRDPNVIAALEDVKKTNTLERYENQAAVMNVTAKFKRLHAITSKAGGLKVVVDDLRADLPDNDLACTAAKREEFTLMQRAAAMSAAKAVLKSATAAVPEPQRSRLLARAAEREAAQAEGATAGKDAVQPTPAAGGGEAKSGNEPLPHEDDLTFKARMAGQARLDKLRAAATATWDVSDGKKDEDIGFVDRHAKQFEKDAARAEGRRRRLADYVGEELAHSLTQTFNALVITLFAFAVMWAVGLMPHQQAASLLARQAELQAAAARAAASAGGAQLEGLDGGEPAPEACPAKL
ncbi:hypothetical protein GPECTOR_25g456 [Gonium pectorale]|uniref:Uncharacterized protein n=1 Tax=Gonium pectorale TaxID=33097 RepID=A0A150GGA6_GONPE|nr:hypothetical protein GPECTOR_25g456 [Gonium pectorale]|eukprot:KXZ48871.1 hypothetical protein GPECTOR_25g456 [Gonium pectorale]